MRKYKTLTLTAIALLSLNTSAQQNRSAEGGIDKNMLESFKADYTTIPQKKALHNAISAVAIDDIAKSNDNKNNFDDNFSIRVKSKGITDQKSSGRCWLFTGLNVLRAQAMAKNNLAELTFSQNYNFFYDQLEKANLFLQSIIDTAERPIDDREVAWLFQNPISDGGTFCGVSDIVTKYGLVPSGAMVETFSANNTRKLHDILTLRLREDGLRLRQAYAEKATPETLKNIKDKSLAEVYKILALSLGEPPVEFEWVRKDSKGEIQSRKTYTPQSYYNELLGNDLKNSYVLLMNDPSREYYTTYEIEFDRHTYDGHNWRYVNVPIEEIKTAAIKSLSDSTAMYFSCDVAKFYDRTSGTLDLNNFDYESLFNTSFTMNKGERITTGASASSHAMTLVGVDLNDKGEPQKWLIENSWGKGANNGHLIATDKWMDEYLFRLVVDKKYASEKVLKASKKQPKILPPWDPLFSEEE